MEMEGGEVGSGHSMIALLEIVPTSKLAAALQFSDNLQAIKKNIAEVTVNYRLPGDTLKLWSGYGVKYNYTPFNELPQSYRFASTVAMFGSLLKESPFAKQVTWNETIIAANESYDKMDPVQKEFITIIEKAKKDIYKKKEEISLAEHFPHFVEKAFSLIFQDEAENSENDPFFQAWPFLLL
jgi:Ca-activated chloride channel family protein